MVLLRYENTAKPVWVICTDHANWQNGILLHLQDWLRLSVKFITFCKTILLQVMLDAAGAHSGNPGMTTQIVIRIILLFIMQDKTYVTSLSLRDIRTRRAFVDKFLVCNKKGLRCLHWNVNAALIWQFLGNMVDNNSCAWCRHEWRLWQQVICHGWRSSSSSPPCTVGSVQPGPCLSQFQICVCVSVPLLSVSKFSLRQSASSVFKSLCSRHARCRLKKTRTAVYSYTQRARENCT